MAFGTMNRLTQSSFMLTLPHFPDLGFSEIKLRSRFAPAPLMACIMLACSQLISDKVALNIVNKIFSAYAKNAFTEHFAMPHV